MISRILITLNQLHEFYEAIHEYVNKKYHGYAHVLDLTLKDGDLPCLAVAGVEIEVDDKIAHIKICAWYPEALIEFLEETGYGGKRPTIYTCGNA